VELQRSWLVARTMSDEGRCMGESAPIPGNDIAEEQA